MSRRALRLAILVIAALALAAAWEIASPWWTLKGMRDAAAAQDSEKLASYVDFPRVRANLREQLIDAADRRIPARAFEAILGKRSFERFIDRIIGFMVSPQSLKIALDVASKVDGPTDATKRACGMKREGLEHFRIRCARLPDGSGDLVFERHGFGWRLVGIDLPDDYRTRI